MTTPKRINGPEVPNTLRAPKNFVPARIRLKRAGVDIEEIKRRHYEENKSIAQILKEFKENQ